MEYKKKATLQIKDSETRLHYAKSQFKGKRFTRKEYMQIHPDISTATASRDLLSGVQNKALIKEGEKNQTLYSFSS